MKPIRVLHVSEYIQGGTATYLNTLVREQLQDHSFGEVRVLAMDRHAEYLLDVPERSLARYPYAERGAIGLLRLAWAVRREIHRYCPSIVHLHGTFAGAVGRLLRLLDPSLWFRLQFVYCSHGWSFRREAPPLRNRACAFVERTISPLAERIICISKDELNGALQSGISYRRCQLIYNALPMEGPPPQSTELPEACRASINQGAKLFLFVGRYDRQKGLDSLLDLFQRVPSTTAVLVACGERVTGGPPLCFGPNSFDLGWTSPVQISDLLQQADALLVPSRWEGFGLVAAEAMRAGRAVICSRRGGLPEVVEHGETGLVLDADDGDQWYRAIVDSTREELQEMGSAGRRRFEKLFTSEKLHHRVKWVYQELLSRKPNVNVNQPTMAASDQSEHSSSY